MWPFDGWPFADVTAAVNGLLIWAASAVGAVLNAIMCPVLKIFETVYNVIVGELNLLILLVNEFIDTYMILKNQVFSIFTDVFPDSVVAYMLITEVILILMYRLRREIGGISIAGFSLGGGK
jgi:hypothetical protein